MKITGDYHTHSTYSDGRNSIVEMVDAAREKGLKTIAITDHGPRNIGTGVKAPGMYLAIKEEVRKLQENRPDIQILVGAEADIISCDGEIDIPPDVVEELDLLLVGLHPYVWPKTLGDGFSFVLGNQFAKIYDPWREKMRKINTEALINAIYRYNVTAITHPGLGMSVDVEKVAQACLETGTAFEVNTGHNFQHVEEIKKAAEIGANFIVNSDAHFTKTVGDVTSGLALLTHANVDIGQIMNVEE